MSTLMKTLLENICYSIQSITAHLHFDRPNDASSWGYGPTNGPDTWGNIWPIAIEGKSQSPISLSWAAPEDPSLNERRLMVQGGKAYFDIENTGETWKATINKDKCDDPIFLKNGPFAEKDVYCLEQFHAHWGGSSLQGSEHLVDGHAYAAELHMVFWNIRYDNFKEASKKKGGLAVLAVFLEEGETRDNELHEVCKMLTEVEHKGSKCICTKAINPSRFLPWHSTSGGRGDMSYWTYEGSLTTPPLFETVTWIVFKKPMTVSKEQLDTMRNLKCNSSCTGRVFSDFNPNEDIPMTDNYRPTQPINDRIVRQVKL